MSEATRSHVVIRDMEERVVEIQATTNQQIAALREEVTNINDAMMAINEQLLELVQRNQTQVATKRRLSISYEIHQKGYAQIHQR